MKEVCGIYCIINNVNNKKYIGQSINVEKRINRHKHDLINNTHVNRHLQRAWNRYSEDNFSFKVLELCSKEELDEKEIEYIKKYDTFKNGYNMDTGGTNGRVISDETRKKISKNHCDVSGENNPMYGKKHTLESKNKIRNNMRDVSGKNNPMYGKKHTQETKDLISNIHKGKKLSSEHIQKLKDTKGSEHHLFKNYPRVTKASVKNGQQSYALYFNGKRIRESLNKEKLQLLCDTEGYLCTYYYKYGEIPEDYVLSNIAYQYIFYYKKMEDNKVCTKYLNVSKNKDSGTKQGFVYVYRTKIDGKPFKISRVDIKKLEEEIKKRNLPWEVLP